MMIVSYSLEPVGGSLENKILDAGTRLPDMLALSDGRYLLSDQTEPGENIFGRLLTTGATPGAAHFPISSTAGSNTGAHSVQLTNGSIVTVYANTNTGTFAPYMTILTEEGTITKSSFAVPASLQPQGAPTITALKDGGYVVAWSESHIGGDIDTYAQRYNASGTAVGGLITVDNSANLTYSPSIAGLKGGGFVVAYSQQPTGGGDAHMEVQIFDKNGASTGAAIEIDPYGSINDQVKVIGLKDGGFAVAYRDDGWTSADTDITVAIFNASGGMRGDYLRINANDLSDGPGGGDVAESQGEPTLAQLGNGDLVVGWTTPIGMTDDNVMARVITLDGAAVTGITPVATSSLHEIESSFAASGEGHVGVAWTRTDFVGHDNVAGGLLDLVRTSLGTDNPDTATGDGLTDHMFGLAGKDHLSGAGGDDLLSGGGDNDRLVGGDGNDTLNGGTGTDRLYGGAGDDVLGGGKLGDKLKGADGDDALDGGKGADSLKGGDGADTLTGGRGPDRLDAGKDHVRDTFAFTSKHDSGHGSDPAGWDHLVHFDVKDPGHKGSDKIDLSAIDTDGKPDDQKFRFVDAFTHAQGKEPDGQVTVEESGKDLKVLVDVNGDNHADMILLVTHVDALHKVDFIL